MKPRLRDIIVCPRCRGSLSDGPARPVAFAAVGAVQPPAPTLECQSCGATYPVIDDVPVLLPEGSPQTLAHMTPRRGYYPWIHRHVLTSLPIDRLCLDIGAGDMALDHPNIVRLDIFLSPHVDVVADSHALPFRDGAFDFTFSIAVLEHLRQPFLAAAEMRRTLKPGGQVYADTNFVFPHHSYPHHYFNFSRTGIETVFAQAGFHPLDVGVPPYLTPAWAVIHLINAYLDYFAPLHSDQEREFVATARKLLEFPLHEFDQRFPPDVKHIFAAGVHYYGQRRPGTILPNPIANAWRDRPDLQREFAEPEDLSGQRPNLMAWANTHGRRESAEIDAELAARPLIEPTSLWLDDRPPLRRGESYVDLTHRLDEANTIAQRQVTAIADLQRELDVARRRLESQQTQLEQIERGRVMRALNWLRRRRG